MKHFSRRSSTRRRHLVGSVAGGRAVAQALEPRRLLCTISLDGLAAPTWSGALERHAAQSDGAAAGDAHVSIIWSNRGATGGAGNDFFNDTFGANAAAARAVVDQVLADWSAAITSFGRADGTESLQVNISMQSSGVGFGAAAAPSSTNVPADGKPRTGAMSISRGLDTNGDGKGDGSGWYLDPHPEDSSEVTGDQQNAFSGRFSDANTNDLYNIVSLELTHVLGLITGSGYNGYKLATSGYATVTNSPDKAEAGPSNSGSLGYYSIFDGPTIKHLLSTNNGGAGGSNWGSPIHTAGSGGTLTFGSVTYNGNEDSGNALYGGDRYLPNEVVLRILSDAYGYSIADPKALPNLFSVLDVSTGSLSVRGRTGSANSSDTISITQTNSTITVSVDIGADFAGSGALPGAGDTGVYVSTYDASTINSIIVDAGDGNDVITVEGIKPITVRGSTGNDQIRVTRSLAGVPVVIRGDGDDDSIYVGVNNLIDAINGNLTLEGGGGTDSMFVEDQFNTFGDVYTLAGTSFDRTITRSGGIGTIHADDTIEAMHLQAGSGNSQINLLSINGNATINAGAGNDTITVGNASNTLDDIAGYASIVGDDGVDSVVLNDAGNVTNVGYTLTSNTVQRSTGLPVTYDAESFQLNAGSGNNNFTLLSSGNNVAYRILAGAGDDTLYLGGFSDTLKLDPIDGAVTFDGQSGTLNALFVNNSAESLATAYALTGTTVAATGMATATYANLQAITVNGGSGPDTFNVSPSTTTTYFIDGKAPSTAASADTLTINAAGGVSGFVNTPTTSGSGNWTFTNRARIDYANIESTSAVGGNVAPTIASLSASPNPVGTSNPFTLTANSVSDADGTIARVSFYHETNNIAGLQIGSDELLGSDTSASGGWTYSDNTFFLDPGNNVMYAVATDNGGAVSATVSTTLIIGTATHPPTVGTIGLSDNPITAGSSVTATAFGVSDQDGNLASVRFYRNSDGVAGLNPSTDQLLGTDTNGADGWSTTFSTSGWTAGVYVIFAYALDTSGLNSNTGTAAASTSLNVTTSGNQVPFINSLTATPGVVAAGDPLTLTAAGVGDIDGTVNGVTIYRESNGIAGLQIGSDTVDGSATNQGSGNWTASKSTSYLAAGTYTFYAVATDNLGAASTIFPSVTVTVQTPVLPDLAPVTPSGWSSPIVISGGTGTHTDAASFGTTDTLYIDAAVINLGNAVATNVSHRLYLDGNVLTTVSVGTQGIGDVSMMFDVAISNLSAGQHTLEVRADVNGNVPESNESNNVFTRVFTVVPPAIVPHVTSSAFVGETNPLKFRFTFDQDVSLSLQASDLVVTKVGSSAPLAVASVSWNAADATATFTMAAGIPADGNYVATLPATSVGFNGTPMNNDATVNFFLLAGNVNGDRVVNFDDLLILAKNYNQTGRTLSTGNVNYSADGKVDFDDLLVLAKAYNHTLAAAISPAADAAPAAPTRRRGAAADLEI